MVSHLYTIAEIQWRDLIQKICFNWSIAVDLMGVKVCAKDRNKLIISLKIQVCLPLLVESIMDAQGVYGYLQQVSC